MPSSLIRHISSGMLCAKKMSDDLYELQFRGFSLLSGASQSAVNTCSCSSVFSESVLSCTWISISTDFVDMASAGYW